MTLDDLLKARRQLDTLIELEAMKLMVIDGVPLVDAVIQAEKNIRTRLLALQPAATDAQS